MKKFGNKLRPVVAGTVTGIAACVIAGSVWSAAGASDGPTLLTSDEAKDAWTAATNASPWDLPGGQEYPAEDPGYFDEVGEPTAIAQARSAQDAPHQEFFEAGLVEQMTWVYARCAWLEEAVKGEVSDDSESMSAALGELASLERENTASDPAYGEYLAALRKRASAQGVSPESIEYAQDCVDAGVSR